MKQPFPYLSNVELQEEARRFLLEVNPRGCVPVDVESILDFHVGAHIVPTEHLRRDYGADGWLNPEGTEMLIDWAQFHDNHQRMRFTIAHELCHWRLHNPILRTFDIRTIDDWRSVMRSIGGPIIRRVERQANYMAGAMLMPTEQLTRSIAEYQNFLQLVDFEATSPSEMIQACAEFASDEYNVSLETAVIRMREFLEETV